MRRYQLIEVIAISDVISTDAKKIVVRRAQTGKLINLPNRPYVQIYPGRVIIPMWLGKKLNKKENL